MFFDKKAQKVEKLLIEQFEQIQRVLDELKVMLYDYLKADREFKKESFEIHKMEHDADLIRRKIGHLIFQGAFLPVYREDYFRLVEIVDKIANQAEAVGDFVTLTRPEVPAKFLSDFKKLIDTTVDHFKPLKTMVSQFLEGESEIMETAKTIRKIESDIDSLQFYLTRSIFKTDLPKIEKFHLKDFIDGIAKISNRIEDASDQLEIIISKHKL